MASLHIILFSLIFFIRFCQAPDRCCATNDDDWFGFTLRRNVVLAFLYKTFLLSVSDSRKRRWYLLLSATSRLQVRPPQSAHARVNAVNKCDQPILSQQTLGVLAWKPLWIISNLIHRIYSPSGTTINFLFGQFAGKPELVQNVGNHKIGQVSQLTRAPAISLEGDQNFEVTGADRPVCFQRENIFRRETHGNLHQNRYSLS